MDSRGMPLPVAYWVMMLRLLKITYLCGIMQLTDKQIKQISDTIHGTYTDVVFAYIFGTAGSGEMIHSSDIDLAIYVDSVESKSSLVSGIIGVVEEIVPGRSCDLVILNDADPLLAFEAISGRKLFVRPTAVDAHAAFYSLTCRMYEDQTVWMKKQLKYRGYEVQWDH